MLKNYRVVVIPDLNKGRPITRQTTALNASAAAGAVLSLLPLGCVDCVEVSQVQPGRRATSKIAYYSCLYGETQGFRYEDRVFVAS